MASEIQDQEKEHSTTPSLRGRVLFVTNTNWYFWTHRLPMANALRDAGWQVSLAAPEEELWASKKIRDAGFDYHPIAMNRSGSNPIRELQSLIELFRIYRALRPEILHQITIKPVLYGTLAGRLLGVSHIVNAIAGRGWALDGEGLVGKIRSQIGMSIYRILMRSRRVHLLFQNPDDRDAFATLNVGSKGSRHLILGSGVDSSWAVTPPPSNPAPIILFASRLLWSKGLDDLRVATNLLREQGYEIRLRVAGEPDEHNPDHIPKSTIQGWHRNGDIEWLGKRTDIEGLMARSDIVALPTRYSEGVPRVLIEAAATGRPIVASDSPGCREIVLDQETGFLVEKSNTRDLSKSIEKLLKSADLRSQMGHAGRQHFEQHFTAEAVGQQTVDLYRQISGDDAGEPEPSSSIHRAWGMAAVYLLARVVPSLLSIGTLAILTRSLTPDSFGTLSLGLSAGIMINGLVFSWLGATATRFLPGALEQPGAILRPLAIYGAGSAIFLFTLALAPILLGIADASAIWPGLAAPVVLVAIGAGCADLANQIAAARQAPGRYAIGGLVRGSTWLLIAATTLLSPKSALFLLLGKASSDIVGALATTPDLRSLLQDHNVEKRKRFSELFSYGAPLALALFGSLILGYSDRFFILFFRDTAQVGVYAAGYDLTQQTIGFLSAAIALAGRPRVFHAFEKLSTADTREELSQFAAVLLPSSFLLTFLFIGMSTEIENLILGGSFTETSPFLIPLIAGGVLLSSVRAHYTDLSFHFQKDTVGLVKLLATGAALNCVLNIALIPRWGLDGAALATLLSYAAILWRSIALGSQTFPVNFPWALASRSSLAGAATACLLLWMPAPVSGPTVVAKIAFGLACFGVLFVLSGLWQGRPKKTSSNFEKHGGPK
ncbi:glycosyltransferase [bacterium]|nr:glycosyltransferase [bacterium]